MFEFIQIQIQKLAAKLLQKRPMESAAQDLKLSDAYISAVAQNNTDFLSGKITVGEFNCRAAEIATQFPESQIAAEKMMEK